MSCGVGHRSGLDPMLCRPAAGAPIRTLARKLPYPSGVALKRKAKKKKTKKQKKKPNPQKTKGKADFAGIGKKRGKMLHLWYLSNIRIVVSRSKAQETVL